MFRGLIHLYSWRYAVTLITVLQASHYRVGRFLHRFWTARDIAEVAEGRARWHTARNTRLLLLTQCIAVAAIATGVWWLAAAPFVGARPFGVALLVGYPILSVHLLAVVVLVAYLARPKYVGRRILARILASQVRQLRQRHEFQIVAIVGSVGKTSTKTAIAKALGAHKRVLWQEGNYNVDVTVPLVLFEHTLPGLFNISAWVRIWRKNRQTIRRQTYGYDIVVLELGTDEPGQIEQFAYLEPDIVVVTAIAPEHMEYFRTLDAVAEEELSALAFAGQALINIDDTDARYLDDRDYVSYGLQPAATYYATKIKEKGLKGQSMELSLAGAKPFTLSVPMLGLQGAKMTVAAAAVSHMLGLSDEDIKKGLKHVEAFAGRMRLLPGIKDATLVDDTYNASPLSVKAALDVIYATKAPQKIAILGSMNELGTYGPDAHREVGEHCDPKQLDLIVTIGHDANTYLAPIAKQKGCVVKTFKSPYAAGLYVKKKLKAHALVLAKGSQNLVFAEEALKQLLLDAHDATAMVRQSESWMDSKRRQFSDFIE